MQNFGIKILILMGLVLGSYNVASAADSCVYPLVLTTGKLPDLGSSQTLTGQIKHLEWDGTTLGLYFVTATANGTNLSCVKITNRSDLSAIYVQELRKQATLAMALNLDFSVDIVATPIGGSVWYMNRFSKISKP